VAAAELGEFIGRDVIANDRVLEIRPPINMHRAWDMAGVVEQDILIRFDDAEALVAEVLLETIGINHRFRMRVFGRVCVH